MNKQFFRMLLVGVLVFSTGTFVSCSDDNENLDSRLTVVEGMIRDIKEQLENLPAGSTVTSATQNNGIWTLVLSSGQTITINPSTGGGGASLDVVEKENSIVITVDGTEYELPLGAGFYTLVYVPEFTDGEARTGSNGRATVKFLVKPALTAASLENTSFTIGAAHELQTRAARDLFSVDGEVTLDGEYINVPFRALEAESAGKTYAVALQMNRSGTGYVSNYFNLVVSGDFVGMPEEIVAANLIEAVTDYVELENGFATATLPEPTVDPLGTFNFTDLFASLPEGAVRFELGSRANQNDNVAGRYDVFRDALSADGTWELKARPGTNGDAPNDEQNSGILINVVVDDVIKHKIYWKIVDPVAALPTDAFAGDFNGSPHIEYPEDVVWEKGARVYELNKEFTAGDFNPMHDGGNFVEAFQNYEVLLGSDYLIYNDGEELLLGEMGAKLAKHSRGLYWSNRQSSIAASQRRNLDIPEEEKGNGEIIAGYDGIPANEMWNTFGFRITNNAIEMSENYGGNALRVGIGLRYEYAYGERSVGVDGALVFLWINRRVSPEGVTDPAPR